MNHYELTTIARHRNEEIAREARRDHIRRSVQRAHSRRHLPQLSWNGVHWNRRTDTALT